MYLASDRKEYILKVLADSGSVRTTVLAKDMNVTDETVRNDLIKLEKNGLLKREHGGAVSLKKKAINDSLINNVSLDVNIVKAASTYIEGGKTLFIDGGGLGNMLTAHLPSLPMTIITNSHSIISRLEPHSKYTVYCTGGQLEASSGLLVGQEAAKSIDRLNIDTAIFSPDSYSPERGAGYSSLAKDELYKKAVKYAKRVIVLAPHATLTATSTFSTIPADKVDILITNESVPPEIIELLEKTKVQVVKA